MSANVTRWSGRRLPDEQEIRRILDGERLRPYSWSNGPGDRYAAHSHSYDKVIYVVHGSITFGLPDSGEEVTLGPGDRLELGRQIRHDAVVGPDGVLCLEAHRS